MGRTLLVTLIAVVTVGLPVVVLFRIYVSRRHFGTPVERATYETLHTASMAAPPLRSGLGPTAAAKAAGHLRAAARVHCRRRHRPRPDARVGGRRRPPPARGA